MHATSDGAIGQKTYAETIEIFELFAKKSKQIFHGPSRAQARAERDKITTLELKIDAMMKILDGKDSKNIPLDQIVAM